MKKEIEFDYMIWREGKYYVSRCLNIELSSFGNTREEALKNLKEALELYLEDNISELIKISDFSYGRETVNA